MGTHIITPLNSDVVDLVLIFTVFSLLVSASLVIPQTRRAEYYNAIERIVEYNLKESHNIIDKWKKDIQRSNLFGYSTTAYPALWAELLGFMYRQTADKTYVSEAVKMLLRYEEFKKLFPKEFYEDRVEYQKGLPPLSDFFSMASYPKAYKYIKDSEALSQHDRKIIEKGVSDCANFLFNYPEWGPMNRAILRAETFLNAWQVLPDHPDALKWKKMADILARDSYQQWEEEDAVSYHPVWLLSLMRYVDAMNDGDFYRSAIPRYYFDYFAHLITPAGLLPDFGDGRWPTEGARWIAIFEKAAAVYREPTYKWIANQFWEIESEANSHSVFLGLVLADAYQWMDETIEPQPISGKSRLIMDDIVGKKIVFRNGIDQRSTYLMLNYRDEGDGAFTSREFLRTSITAEEEKTHHGHSDENAICSLFSGGSILLHDAGYRDKLPSGEYGRYRADYFHNRLVVRKNKRWIQIEGEKKEQPIWEFIRNSGAYRPVETKLIDFLSFEKVDMSRTRLVDAELGYEWDRIVTYHKQDDFFVIVDGIKVLHHDFYTFTNLWHTEKILNRGAHWFNTRIDKIDRYKINGTKELLIYFPLTEHERSKGTFELVRHNQPENSIYETISSYYFPGHIEVFVSILFPHEANTSLNSIIERFEIIMPEKFPRAIGLKYKNGRTDDYLCVKLDLLMDYQQQNYRPRYDFERGKVTYADFTTDGSFLFASKADKKLYWACSNMVKLSYRNKTLHESLMYSFGLQPDVNARTRWGRAKWRYWEDEIDIDL